MGGSGGRGHFPGAANGRAPPGRRREAVRRASFRAGPRPPPPFWRPTRTDERSGEEEEEEEEERRLRPRRREREREENEDFMEPPPGCSKETISEEILSRT
ncbi:protein Shroom4-like [Anolis carolinensis]|uniref:protein Shroom4-like n=1 Tax=Anolis carolinensis TaxID=28377 RepID=UPI002F2B4E87